MRPTLLLLTTSLFLLPAALNAKPHAAPHKSSVKTAISKKDVQEKRAIVRTLTKDLGRTTSDHIKISGWSLTDLDIQSQWALANVEPAASNHADPFMVLLNKKHSQWKIITLGTNLRSSGKQFNVPRRLWQKWAL